MCGVLQGNGETPLHKACKENKLEACRALIEAGASVTVKPRSGNVLAMRKCAKDYPRVASLIRGDLAHVGIPLRVESVVPQSFKAAL